MRHQSLLRLGDIRRETLFSQFLLCSDNDDAITLADKARRSLESCSAEGSMKTLCNSHEASGFRAAVGRVRPGATQRVQHFILSLNLGGHARIFRSAWKAIFMKKAVPVRDRLPSQSVRSRNLSRLNLFCPDRRENKVQCMEVTVLIDA